MPYTCEGCDPRVEAHICVNSPGIRRGRGGFAWKDVSGNEVAEATFRLEGGGKGVCNPWADLEQILWASPTLPLLVKEASRG